MSSLHYNLYLISSLLLKFWEKILLHVSDIFLFYILFFSIRTMVEKSVLNICTIFKIFDTILMSFPYYFSNSKNNIKLLLLQNTSKQSWNKLHTKISWYIHVCLVHAFIFYQLVRILLTTAKRWLFLLRGALPCWPHQPPPPSLLSVHQVSQADV